MKLRTKIMAITAAVIMAAVAVNDTIIWLNQRKSLYSEAENKACQQIYAVTSEYQLFSDRLNDDVGTSEKISFFKSLRDDYVICVQNEKEIYNQTILTQYELKNADYSNLLFTENNRILYSYIKKAGRNLLITHNIVAENTHIYYVTDMYEVDLQITRLTVFMLIISIGIMVFVLVLLYILLKHALTPLDRLSESAKDIADGEYQKRVSVKTNDEIGVLTENFNAMAEAVEQKISELKESENKKTMFMADFSHELKTPLTAISGYAQTMLNLNLSDADKKEALSYIYSESNRLDRLSKKMKRLLELDNTVELQMEKISVSRLFDEAVKTCTPSAQKRKIRLVTEQHDGKIHGDFDLLHDVLCNLIDNALKASDEGTAVKLGAEKGRIVVSDLGCGIPADEIDKITEPFYMVDKSRSRKSGSAGLGLALVSQILRLHNIKMTIESEINNGTKIILHFDDNSMNT